MKNKKSLLGILSVLGLISLGLISVNSSSSLLQANLLALGETDEVQLDYDDVTVEAEVFTANIEDKLDIPVQYIAPESPDFMNDFRNVKSELAFIAAYDDQIKGDRSKIHTQYMPEILSFVHTVGSSPYVSNKLPMWPEYNITTVGNVLAYLFPEEANPMLYAKGVRLVPLNARSESYMSRAELIHILSMLYVNEGRDAHALLAASGFIDDEDNWKSETKEGFLLVEAVRVVLNIREIIERTNIQESKSKYANRLADLGEGALTLDEDSLEALMLAFVNELTDEEQIPRISKRVRTQMEKSFSARYGLPLTAELVTEARDHFFKAMNRKATEVYELPPLMTAGRCDNQMFKKGYMGSVAVTGPLGASILCEKVMIQFPANAYLLNIHSLPKITISEDPDNEGRLYIRTDVIRSYKNALILSPNGEEKARFIIRPEGVEDMIGQEYEVAVKEQNSELLVNHVGLYEEEGAVIRTLLREFSGDNLIIFDKVATPLTSTK
jgi:hypothetical protein